MPMVHTMHYDTKLCRLRQALSSAFSTPKTAPPGMLPACPGKLSVRRPSMTPEMQRIVGHGDLSMAEKVYYHPDTSKVLRKMASFGDDLLRIATESQEG